MNIKDICKREINLYKMDVRRAFYVDKLLYPSKRKRIALYTTSIIGVGIMLVAFGYIFLSNLSSASLELMLLGVFIAIIPVWFWTSRVTSYIYNKENKKEK